MAPPLRVRPAALRPVAAAALSLLAGVALAQTDSPAQPPLALRATPLLAEKVQSAPGPTFIQGDQISGRTGLETVVEGQAELRQPGRAAHADRMAYDQTTDIVTITGNARLNVEGDRYTGTSGRMQLDATRGFVLQPSYAFIANGAHGDARRIDLLDADRSSIAHGDYTTCRRDDPRDTPGWLLRADRIDIDREDDEGRAEGAVLEFQGVPILPLPVMSFPISERRKSGWLPPTMGLDSKSGLNLSVPYYWNIAPNRDATFTPAVMTRRGANLAGEFRYAENAYQGRINANITPDDKLRNGDTRWGYFVRHNGSIDTGLASVGNLGLSLNLNRVSDNDYWRDFTRNGLSLTTRLLANDATLSWGKGDFSFSARTLKWQTLQDVSSPIVPPYDRMPQLVGRWGRVNDRGFDYSVETDYTEFHADRSLTNQPNAKRGYVWAQLARPFTRPWGFFTPKLQLHGTQYSFDAPIASGATSASRLVPTVSLDGGLVFERDARYFGRNFVQTLEPRLMYIYTPYRNQSQIPNYDTGAYDFNFATIWIENAFAGHDRIVDNNLVTAGLTSRLLDPESGAEMVRLSMAQRYRFSAQQVVLPGGTPAERGLSDLMLGAGINWDPRWAFDSVVQYNVDTRRSTRTTLQARYTPGDYRTISLAYRLQRDLGSKSIDVGWQWPLSALVGRRGELGSGSRRSGGSCRGGGLYSVGRLNYSLQDSRLVEGILGLEYDAGCWIGRVVVEKINSSLTSSTKRMLFQIEFVGLSRLGSNPLAVLRNSIPSYKPLGREVTTPSRFTEYE